MNKQTKEILIIGVGGVIAYLIYRNYQNQKAAAAAATTATQSADSTAPISALATGSDAVVPAATDTGVVNVSVQWMDADNQYGHLWMEVGILIHNGTSSPVLITQFNLQGNWGLIGPDLAAQGAGWPSGYTGNIGTISFPGPIQINPGSNYTTNLSLVQATKNNNEQNWYLGNIMDVAAEPGTRDAKINWSGSMVVNGLLQNITTYLVI